MPTTLLQILCESMPYIFEAPDNSFKETSKHEWVNIQIIWIQFEEA